MNEKVVNQIFSSLLILSIGIKTNNAKKINDIKTINKPSLNFQFLFFQFRLGNFSHIPLVISVVILMDLVT